MEIEFDPAKDEENIRKHGMSLTRAKDVEIDKAQVKKDNRKDYGEDRFIAVGPLDGRLCVLIFTLRDAKVRAISLRRANAREQRRFAR